jgi:hypothetical protein
MTVRNAKEDTVSREPTTISEIGTLHPILEPDNSPATLPSPVESPGENPDPDPKAAVAANRLESVETSIGIYDGHHR